MNTRGHQFGLFLKRIWRRSMALVSWDRYRDRRERRIWARAGRTALVGKLLEERRHQLRKQVIIAVEHGAYGSSRPYLGCMSKEHFDVIMRNRVVVNEIDGKMIYELNTKDLAEWEVEEFHFMLLDDTENHPKSPIIREVISDRFPQ